MYLLARSGSVRVEGSASAGDDLVMTACWRDPDTPWQAKLARASSHIDTLARAVGDYERELSVCHEPGSELGSTVYRLVQPRPIPIEFSTIIGDVLHNLRSSLDSVAFEFARRHLGDGLTEELERRVEFPIRDDRFDDYMDQTVRRDVRRRDVYEPVHVDAMRAVQPGHDYDEALADGDDLGRNARDIEVRLDLLLALTRLNNIDKHRFVHQTIAQLRTAAIRGEHPPRWIPGERPLDDGSVVATLIDQPEHPHTPGSVSWDVRLVLDSTIWPYGSNRNLVDSMKRMQEHVEFVIEQMFTRVEPDCD